MNIATPLTRVNLHGHIGYDDLRLNLPNEKKKTLAYKNPLVMLMGKSNEYGGEKGANAHEFTLRTITVNNPTVRFQEFDVQIPYTGTAQAESAEGSTTLNVGASIATHLRPADMLHFSAQNFNVRVVSVTQPIDGTVTIERAVGAATTSPATLTPVGFTRTSDLTIPEDAQFIVIAPTVVQNSLSRPVRNYNAVTIREAATQIIRDDLKQSRTRKAQDRTSKAKQETFEERKLQSFTYQLREIESMILFGKLLTSNLGRVGATGSTITTTADAEGNTYTASDGIFNVVRSYASGNVIAANATVLGGGNSAISRDKLNRISQILSDVGGGHILLTSSALLYKINDILTDPQKTQLNINFEKKTDAVGNPVLTFNALFGKLDFKEHPLFNSLARYQKTILAIKPENIGLINLEGEVLKWKPDSQENDRDGEAGYFNTELGLVMAYAKEAFIFDEWDI